MIGEPLAASVFLYVAPAFFLALYGLPLLFVPMRWARVFQWRVPEGPAHLTVFFGRCLGGVATAVALVAIAAAPHPEANVALFDLIALIGVIMTAVHVWGAIKRMQPWPEHVEIALYGLLAVAAIAVRP